MSYTVSLIDCIGSDPGHGTPAIAYISAYYRRVPGTGICGFTIRIEDTATGYRHYFYATSSASDAAREWLAVSGFGLTVSRCFEAADEARRHWRAVEMERA